MLHNGVTYRQVEFLYKFFLSNKLLIFETCHSPEFFHNYRHFASAAPSTVFEKMTRKNKNKNMGKKKSFTPETNERAPQNQRPKSKQYQLRPASTINIVVVGTGGPGTCRSLLVTTELNRYMFNCGEGTQRLAAMGKGLRLSAFAKLTRLENIFITHKSWENTGGLLGLAMRLENQLNPESRIHLPKGPAGAGLNRSKDANSVENAGITIYGPPGVEKAALMARKFAESTNLKIVKAKDDFNDGTLSIHPVPFYSHAVEEQNDSDNDEPAAKKKRRKSSTVPENSIAFAYICQPKPSTPKINVEKCLDAGITMGPMVGQLQRGISVTLENGTVVYPEQVTDNVDNEKRPFLVLECPTLEFLPSLNSCAEISSRMDTSGDDSFALVVHMTPQRVYDTEQYQTWMKRFSRSTNHLVLNRSAGEADLIRVREHQAMLNLINAKVFPELPAAVESDLSVETKDSSEGRTVFASSGLHYVYRGKDEGFQHTPDDFSFQAIQNECLQEKIGLQEQLKTLEQTHNNEASSNDSDTEDEQPGCTQKYPKVVFLGTGSSEPNKIRAQSCIVIQLSKHSVIILDCGEDSYGQLHRFYGAEKAGEMLRKVKGIFVSHMHGDHYLGLFTLLKEREKAFVTDGQAFSPVLLMAPIQMRRWLRFYHKELENITHLLRFVKHQEDLLEFEHDLPLTNATFEDVRQELGLEEYQPVEVIHCNNAYGVVFKHANGFKLAFSGDTRPCDRLAQAGKNCDLLIHEATHEDALQAHAKFCKHSTFSEAMDIGAKMDAKHIILTHFSQRYPHMVPFFDMKLPSNVGIAFDNMQVNPQTFGLLPSMIPPLTTLFTDKLHRLEIQRIKREREQNEGESSAMEAQDAS